MATKEQLQALLERVVAATGPDRELDAEITRILSMDEGEFVRHLYTSGPGDWYVGPKVNRVNRRPVPAYTASIDAALALVERVLPGHTAGWQPGIGNREWATIYRVAENEVGMVEKANHATLPLALLAALLETLIAQSEA